MKKTENKNTVAVNMTDVNEVLKKMKYNTDKFEVIRKFDNEEFNENTTERKSYANIRSKVDNRSIVKLWGHKNNVTVECSKMLRKREEVKVDTELYTSKALDKNNNYICSTVSDAVAVAVDFITQIDKQLYTEKKKAKATQKATQSKKAN